MATQIGPREDLLELDSHDAVRKQFSETHVHVMPTATTCAMPKSFSSHLLFHDGMPSSSMFLHSG